MGHVSGGVTWPGVTGRQQSLWEYSHCSGSSFCVQLGHYYQFLQLELKDLVPPLVLLYTVIDTILNMPIIHIY